MASRFTVYGLGVESNVPLAGVAGLDAPREVDVRMTLGALPPSLPAPDDSCWIRYHTSTGHEEDGTPHRRIWRLASGEWFRVAYSDGTIVAVSAAGDEVWTTWPEGATVEDTATYLLGPTLGFVLRLRGTTCLHASAVALEGRAIVFAGPAGSGKSTLAAAFARRGHPVLTDDVCAIDETGDRFHVRPAYPRVRLWPPSVVSLFGSEEALPKWTPTWDKRFLDLNGARFLFQRQPLPLAGIYLIGERASGNQPRIESVARSEALMALVSDTYATYVLDRSRRAEEFEVLATLVRSVPVHRLLVSGSLERADALCELIERDARGEAAAAA